MSAHDPARPTSEAPRRAGRRLGPLAFWLAQAVLAILVALWAAAARRGFEAERALPRPRAEPLAVAPLRDEPAVVSDAALARVVARVRLPLAGAETQISAVDHSLRLWGAEARFADPRALDGPAMYRLLVDHQRFARVYGEATPPLLVEAADGVRVRTQEGPASASHWDHTLATLTEIGTPLGAPIQTPEGRRTVQALVEQSLADFSLNQAEYEWSILAYALWLPPVDGWRTREGQAVDFDRLAERAMREPLPDGVCSGNHRLYTLVVLLRIDDLLRAEGPKLLSVPARVRVEEFLAARSAELGRHQHPDGFWNFDWPTAAPRSAEPTAADGDRLSDRIIATGHALEWWALAPEALLPPRATIERAAEWIVATVDAMSDEEIVRFNSFLTHAARGLALWRGGEAAELVGGAEFGVTEPQ